MARQDFRFERQWKKIPNSQQPDNIGQRHFIEQRQKLEEMMAKVKNLVGGVSKLMEEYGEVQDILKEHEDVILRKDRPDHSRHEATDGGFNSEHQSGLSQADIGPEPESKDSV